MDLSIIPKLPLSQKRSAKSISPDSKVVLRDNVSAGSKTRRYSIGQGGDNIHNFSSFNFLNKKKPKSAVIYNKKKKEIFVNSYQDLPEEVQKKLKEIKLEENMINEHFEAFIFVLRYMTGERYHMPGQVIPKMQRHNNVSEEVQKKAFKYIKQVENDKDLKKIYKTMEAHGKGGYGRVFIVRDKKAHKNEITGKKEKTYYAIKKIPERNEKEFITNNCEVGCLLELAAHTNIVQMISAYRLHNEIRIVMEFIEGGSLSQLLKIRPLLEPHIFFISQQILCGLSFMHSKKFVHRDLKSNNVMLSIYGTIKIIDFGLCAELTDGPRTQTVGTAHWIAPEIIQIQPHTTKADIWSFGIIFLEMYLRHTPFSSKVVSMFKAICGRTMDCIDLEEVKMREEAYSFCQNCCLVVDPEKRFSADECLQIPIIKSAIIDKDLEMVLSSIFLTIALFNSGI